jgi:DNA-binding NtrC family response regulator
MKESVQLLLVDDEPGFLETMAKRLGRRNFDVRTAPGGLEALELLSESGGEIEVAILDVKMPRMDGIETLGEIKRRYPLVEVIMLTGRGTVGSAIDGMKRGAFDYLMKPCEMAILEKKAREAADRRRRQEKKIVEARVLDLTRRAANKPSGPGVEPEAGPAREAGTGE